MRRAGWGVALLLAACAVHAKQVHLEAQDSGTTVRLRGISAVDADVAWASGREGTVLRTVDGGKQWTHVSVPDAKTLDFRDIEAFDANTAVVLGIGPGEASRIYRTEDGGKSWALTLQNKDERAFFDCMVFEGEQGWMLGDPVDGKFQIRSTTNGGRSWTLWPEGPAAMQDEAAFAASGTCIARANYQQLVIVGGGAASRAHVYSSKAWQAFETPMMHRTPSAGIFSVASLGGGALLVGGDFKREDQGSAAWMRFSAHGTSVDALPAPRGYRSGAACMSADSCIAVGPTGVDVLDRKRRRWSAVSDTGYDAVDLAGTTGWAAGDAGRIARITWSKAPAAPSSLPQPASSTPQPAAPTPPAP